MRVSECMARNVKMITPNDSIREAAAMMADQDFGVLPVNDGERLVGMITDRDIAVRAVALNKAPDTLVKDVMTNDIKYCFDDQNVQEVIENMGDIQVRRLPVVNRAKRLVGIIALGDAAQQNQHIKSVGNALGDISRDGGAHSQSNG